MKKILSTLVLLSLALPASADRFLSGQPADVVLGQADFVSGDYAELPNRFYEPEAVAMDPTTGKVFVADSGHYRILRYSSTAAAQNGSSPEAVIGQPNFTSFSENQGGGATAKTLAFMYQITVDSKGRLWVADSDNNRVLGFFAASSLGNNPKADVVLGQPDFNTTSSDTTAAKMTYPSGVSVGPDDTLWVADTDNNRVLRFAKISSKSSGAVANGVLGQPNFTSSEFGVTDSTMYGPCAVSADSKGRLWVADTYNYRILRFDNAVEKTKGAPANGVLGQPDFTSADDANTATGLYYPYGVFAAPNGTVWVGDYSNKRVVGYTNAASLPNGGAATIALGKPDLTSSDLGPTKNLTSGPVNICAGPKGSILLSDYDDNRVLRFSPFRTPGLTITTPNTTTNSAVFLIKGKATGKVDDVAYRVGNSGSFMKTDGIKSWNFIANLKPGSNIIKVVAEGPGGKVTKTVTITRK
ncbi:MAG: NHL repeat-containing protein [Luteolibacter sp.]|uniref:NHL repeat-containing protein n=1 Tax=Luteolibacter sp. TaxID=1962973 RepID=UPI0032650B96